MEQEALVEQEALDELPENIKITITEAKENELNLTLPLKPEELPLSE